MPRKSSKPEVRKNEQNTGIMTSLWIDIKLQTCVMERLHVISTHTKFEDVLFRTSTFRAYNACLLCFENFENFFPTFGRNGPCGAKMDRVWSKPKVSKNPQEELEVNKFQKATANGLGVIKNNP